MAHGRVPRHEAGLDFYLSPYHAPQSHRGPEHDYIHHHSYEVAARLTGDTSGVTHHHRHEGLRQQWMNGAQGLRSEANELRGYGRVSSSYAPPGSRPPVPPKAYAEVIKMPIFAQNLMACFYVCIVSFQSHFIPYL